MGQHHGAYEEAASMFAGTFDIPLRQQLLLQEGIFLFFVITKRGAGCQLVVAAEFLCDQLLERLIGFFPRGVFNILEGQKNHRILSMVGKIGFSAGPDFLISEVNGSVLGRLFEESAEHIHVQRFFQSVWGGK